MSMMCTCATCGNQFERYNMNATRASKPQYCSSPCWSSALRIRAMKRIEERFLSFVPTGLGSDQCWPWQGRKDPNGYGRFDVKLEGSPRSKPMLAHRMAYEHFHGKVPSTMFVRHKCDNPPCCNPAHLEIGTHLENMADMRARNRASKKPTRIGDEVHTSKLAPHQVLEIFHSAAKVGDLAKQFNVSWNAIQLIKRGRNWSHLTGAKNAV